MTDFLTILKSMWECVKCTFSHIYAWIAYIFALLTTFLGESGVMYVNCLAVSLVADFLVGIWKSKKQGQGFSIKKAEKFIVEGFAYVAFMCLVHIIDIIVSDETVICMQGVALVGVVVKLWSVMSNLTIIFPRFAVIPIIKKLFLTSVAEKLNMTEEELSDNIEQVADPDSPITKLGKKPEEDLTKSTSEEEIANQ